MSERIQHRNKAITLKIDDKQCSGVYGETILEIARRNDIYIPTMCYLTKVSPIGSCRMCAVQVKGIDGDILACQEKAVDGIEVTTNNEHLEHERINIMKLYDVNHPLQCGVCDKSGECELQNKTLEFKVSSQEFAVKDQMRKQKKWGILGYDPHLCIMCEKCVHTCNEIIGAAALYIKPGDATINEHMGDIYWRMGYDTQARFQWERALSFNPTEKGQAEGLKGKIASGMPAADVPKTDVMQAGTPQDDSDQQRADIQIKKEKTAQ